MDNPEINTPQEISVIEEKSPKKNPFVLLLVVFILGALTLAYLFLDGQKYMEELLCKEVQTTEEEKTAPEEEEIDEYADWQTYTNTEYGVSFKYPSDFEVEVNDYGIIIAHPRDEKEGTERDTYLWIEQDTNSTSALEYVETLQEKVENEDLSMNSSLNYTDTIMWGKDAYMYILTSNVEFLSSGYVVEHKDNILVIGFGGLVKTIEYWNIVESITFLD